MVLLHLRLLANTLAPQNIKNTCNKIGFLISKSCHISCKAHGEIARIKFGYCLFLNPLYCKSH